MYTLALKKIQRNGPRGKTMYDCIYDKLTYARHYKPQLVYLLPLFLKNISSREKFLTASFFETGTMANPKDSKSQLFWV